MNIQKSMYMKTIYRIAFIVMAVLMTLPVKAGWNTAGSPDNYLEPQKTFHSTSAMAGSGSPYVSQPAGLNAEGRATYFDGEEDSAVLMRGPRRIGPSPSSDVSDEDWVPIGDAIIPLLMMAIGYGVVLYRRKKAKELSLCD